MIFQTKLSTLDTELSQLEALLNTKRQQRQQLEELDAETNVAIEMVALLKTKIEAVSSDALASLKTAVLTLFDSGDNGSGGEKQPTDPTPDPDDDEPELLCLNGLTGECLTTADDEELLADNPVGDEWVLSSEAPLTGQTCAVNPELYWEITPPDGSSWEFASPLTCLLWEDAPMLEQYCTVTPTDNENKGTEEGEIIPQSSNTEMVHTSARTGYLKLKTNGQILATYAWFSRKDLAEAWCDWLDGMCLGSPKLRKSQRNSSWKYEIKLTGLSMTQVERLASEDLSRKPSKKKETLAQAAGLEPPSGWRQPQLKENSSQLCAKMLLTESEYVGQTLPVSRVSANSIGYTVTLPNGDNRWFRADMVQIVDAEIEENALPTEPTQPEDEGVQMAQNRQEAEAYEFNDIVQVTSDGNDCVGLVGSFGRVKVIKGDRIGVEIDGQLVYFKPDELKVKSKAEAPTHQRSCPPPADMSLSDREATYLQTNGNYTGLAKQTRQRWEQAGINPSDLIADMKAKRPAEPAWNAEKYNPVLVGADDASDF